MDILVSNHHLGSLGGSETFTYTLALELKRLGHNVTVLTPSPGLVSEKLRVEHGMVVNEISPQYDLCLLNHNNTVNWVLENLKEQPHSKIIQTCHGYIPPLEQPQGSKDIKYVSISKEVQNHLKQKGLNSEVIHNGIDLERFKPQGDNSKFNKIYSLSQSDYFNKMLVEVAQHFNVELAYNNKHKNPIWEIEDKIKDSQLIFGLGRSAYEGLAMGKTVFAADARNYMGGKMDGIINQNNIEKYLGNNCSGRCMNITPTVETLIKEIENNFTLDNSSRSIAEEYFDIKKQTQKYLQYAD
jgi:glycosyltransferase involved in cell wall biosynthesis